MKFSKIIKIAVAGVLMAGASSAYAGDSGKNGCGALPGYTQLRAALISAVAAETSGLDLQMWGTIVDRDGVVCAVAYSGANRGSQWPGSRVISAQKANTANAFSLDGLSLSTANLYSATQGTSSATPLGGSLFGLQFSNPVDPAVAYGGNPADAGTKNDPMVGNRVGGVNVFGGGLALYNADSRVVGAVGVSGDTSCADHNIGWRVRNNLHLDNFGTGANGKPLVGGVSGDNARPDNIIFDATNGDHNLVTDGFEHPTCLNTAGSEALPAVQR
jgi:uncharacterized protein GlcG (DUF336 family)